MGKARESAALAMILLAALAVRLVGLNQPIVENYVGRQVPTAMVARNLDRGSGFFRPSLDTGPFPNLFLVEPPGYALAVVGVARLTMLDLEPSGRLVSALAVVLACWSIHGLTRRREGPIVALVAAATFAILPVTIRYGRAFQPDALALALVLTGIRVWDVAEDRGKPLGCALGWLILSAGLALKVIFAFALIPWLGAVASRPRRNLVLGAAALVPAALWYLHASRLLAVGSRASADNASIWLAALVPWALLDPSTLALFARYLLVRAFTPIATALAALSLAARAYSRFWTLWLLAASGMLLGLAGKAHHEYYWLVLAPPVAVGFALGVAWLAGRGRSCCLGAVGIVVAFVALAVVQARSTFETPREWRALESAARAIRRVVPVRAWIVAPEALIHAADRRGCRLDVEPGPAARAAGEWGGTLPEGEPPGLALVEFYRGRGARFFADVGDPAAGRLRQPLHEAIRRRYHPVWFDEPGILIVELADASDPSDESPHAERRPAARHPDRPRALEGRAAADQHADGL